jgi:hypothetical protein
VAKFGEGELLHFNAVRLRLTGSGTFSQSLISLDNTVSSSLPDLTMSNTSGREPLALADYTSQRGYLMGSVTTLGDYFNISRITIFVRPIAEGLPQ